MNIFLSYAIDDKSRIRKVIHELKSKGLVEADDTIIDSSEIFVPGSSLRGVLRQAIEAASKVVVVWSKAGAGSDWVNYEAGMADALGKPILVVVSKGEGRRLPDSLAANQVIELEEAH